MNIWWTDSVPSLTVKVQHYKLIQWKPNVSMQKTYYKPNCSNIQSCSLIRPEIKHFLNTTESSNKWWMKNIRRKFLENLTFWYVLRAMKKILGQLECEDADTLELRHTSWVGAIWQRSTYRSSWRKSYALALSPSLYASRDRRLGSPMGWTWVVGALYLMVATGAPAGFLFGLWGEPLLNRLLKLEVILNIWGLLSPIYVVVDVISTLLSALFIQNAYKRWLFLVSILTNYH